MKKLICALFVVVVCGCADSDGPVVLTASHQWPGGIGDVRDEMVQIIARELNAADVGLQVRVYPGEALFKARDQWSAMVSGRVDIISLPLDYASGRHPQFNATLMPGLVRDHEHAQRLNDSPFMAEIHRVIEQAGGMVLADAWVAGGFVSTRGCIQDPEDIQGQVTRAAGPAFERMLAAAGASIASMPSSEIYTAMQTGVLDAANTSSGSFVSYRIYEQVTCFTAPGDNALWFMYEPVMISLQTWQSLSPEQQLALRAAAAKAETFFAVAGREQDLVAERVFSEAGVDVVHLTSEQVDAWRRIAEESSYKIFADEVAGGRELIDAALAVQ